MGNDGVPPSSNGASTPIRTSITPEGCAGVPPASQIVAHYEYDAFGNEIVTQTTGSKVADFAHRFSTKPKDTKSGLYYYGYRYYNPKTGTWPSRDPIEENGGINLYGFVVNNPLYWILFF